MDFGHLMNEVIMVYRDIGCEQVDHTDPSGR